MKAFLFLRVISSMTGLTAGSRIPPGGILALAYGGAARLHKNVHVNLGA